MIKKIYGDRLKRHRKRNWKLNRLNIDKDSASIATNEDKEYLDFLEDLEEDPKSREHVNIYKGESLFKKIFLDYYLNFILNNCK